MSGNLCLVLNVVSTWAMVGLIWLIQIVHYPLFAGVGDPEFKVYAEDHQRLITYVVLPLMFVELATSVGLWSVRPHEVTSVGVAVGIALVLVIWLSTFCIQVPQHTQLAKGFDTVVHQRLVSGNWIRTVAWTLRGILTGYFVFSAMK